MGAGPWGQEDLFLRTGEVAESTSERKRPVCKQAGPFRARVRSSRVELELTSGRVLRQRLETVFKESVFMISALWLWFGSFRFNHLAS